MKIMAVDYGDARTGLAACDKIEMFAAPLGVITEYNFEKTVLKVANAAEEYGVEMVVVGHPVNMDGSRGERAKKCELFAEMLRKLIPIPVELWDERSTTVLAYTYLKEGTTKGKKKREVVDEVAATIILESYMDYRENLRKKGEL